MSAAHTPGPWRWEMNQSTKEVNLVGGVPRFDLTVMDFVRWGMGSAAPRFRDTALDGMNLMDRVCDKPEWLQDFPGRSHHARWCRAVIHPDAVLMATAPDLLDALERLVRQHGSDGIEYSGDHPIAVARAAIAKATGSTT